MHLVSFSLADRKPRPGVLLPQNGTVIDLSADYTDSLAVVAAGIHSIDNDSGVYPSHKLSDVRLHAPLANPPRVFAIGLNYREHAAETGRNSPPCLWSSSRPTAIIGPGDTIVLPKNSSEPDYEAEFAFVIGKGGYRIPACGVA